MFEVSAQESTGRSAGSIAQRRFAPITMIPALMGLHQSHQADSCLYARLDIVDFRLCSVNCNKESGELPFGWTEVAQSERAVGWALKGLAHVLRLSLSKPLIEKTLPIHRVSYLVFTLADCLVQTTNPKQRMQGGAFRKLISFDMRAETPLTPPAFDGCRLSR